MNEALRLKDSKEFNLAEDPLVSGSKGEEKFERHYNLNIQESNDTEENNLLLYRDTGINDIHSPDKERDDLIMSLNVDRNIAKSTTQKICPFCGKTFSHSGSYGRHLDNKKGDSVHPGDQVDIIRSKVVRRNGTVDMEKIAERRTRKRIASRLYNKQQVVKEKNKARRKSRDHQIKARLEAYNWFLDQFGQKENLSFQDYDFPTLVCTYLPVSSWGIDVLPSVKEFESLGKYISNVKPSFQNVLSDKFKQWNLLETNTKTKKWHESIQKALSNVLNHNTLYDLHNKYQIIDSEKKRRLDAIDSHLPESKNEDSAPEFNKAGYREMSDQTK